MDHRRVPVGERYGWYELFAHLFFLGLEPVENDIDDVPRNLW